MSQEQNRDNDLFNFDNPPPQPSPYEPTAPLSGGSAKVYEVPEESRSPQPPPPYIPPPPVAPPPGGPPPAKSNRIWLIVVIILVLLCCCCLLFLVFMYYVGGDWIIQNLETMQNMIFPLML
jgi:hypothetical protein